MALLLLDTTVLIDLSKNYEPTTTWIEKQSADGHDLAICPITIAEFYAGLGIADHAAWDELIRSLVFCPIDLTASVQAGVWRATYRTRGIQLSTADVLIAAAAVLAGATIVTSNVRHYPMDVSLVDPRAPGST